MSKYFRIWELLHSETAIKHSISNIPSDKIVNNLDNLMINILDPLREQWTDYCKKNNLGNPAIRVTSGYRCQQLNKLVGGVSSSAHLYGYAADLQPVNKQQGLFERFVSKVFVNSGVKFDQCIIEKSGESRWIHIAQYNKDGRQRMKCFSILK